MEYDSCLHFATERLTADRCKAIVSICQPYVQSLYTYILKTRQNESITQGFIKGATPLAYFESNFKNNIVEHLKELFFTHCVINFLYQKISEHKIELAGEPTIKEIMLDPATGATYIFELNQVQPPIKTDWKRMSLKQPTRKNYKDLDRQVEYFLQDEQEKATKLHRQEIAPGDWILFGMTLIDADGTPVLTKHTDHVWLRLGDEVIDREAYELFYDKKVGDCFTSSSDFLQEYINNNFDVRYLFVIEIKDRVPFTFFSLEQFKKQFKLKTTKETHAKLIEVFSYRNDMSQRRETVEALFKMLLNHYSFAAPDSLAQQQEELVLRSIQTNPDYHVYKAQADFKHKIRMLAEKQVKEHILIDHIAYDEQIQASDEDIVTYLNLTKRPRTKEFIYFDIPSFKARGHETPIPRELIRHCCLYEKTLNYLIGYLTKRA